MDSKYLHKLHQHHQCGGSCGIELAGCSTLVVDWNLKRIEHHPEKLVHYQHRSGHCYMVCHL